MSEKIYQTFEGFLQFDEPTIKTYEGTPIKEFMIRASNVQSQPYVRISLWGDLADLDVGLGDFVMADGSYTRNSSKQGDKVFHNLRASKVAVVKGVVEQRSVRVQVPPTTGTPTVSF